MCLPLEVWVRGQGRGPIPVSGFGSDFESGPEPGPEPGSGRWHPRPQPEPGFGVLSPGFESDPGSVPSRALASPEKTEKSIYKQSKNKV